MPSNVVAFKHNRTHRNTSRHPVAVAALPLTLSASGPAAPHRMPAALSPHHGPAAPDRMPTKTPSRSGSLNISDRLALLASASAGSAAHDETLCLLCAPYLGEAQRLWAQTMLRPTTDPDHARDLAIRVFGADRHHPAQHAPNDPLAEDWSFSIRWQPVMIACAGQTRAMCACTLDAAPGLTVTARVRIAHSAYHAGQIPDAARALALAKAIAQGVRGRMSDVGCQKSDARGQKSEGGR